MEPVEQLPPLKEEIFFVSEKQDDGSVIHVLRCIEPFYTDVKKNRKRFEIRKDDRDFHYRKGDTIILYQVVDGKMTGDYIVRKVTYVLKDAEMFGLKPGYCIMSLK